MLPSLQLLLAAGAGLLPFAAAQADLVGTWSTKSHSVFTGPVCLETVFLLRLLDQQIEIRIKIYQAANTVPGIL